MALTTPEERQAYIMDCLVKSPSIQIADICATFGVSEVTARHDLMVLERSGRLKRTRGGAVSLSRTMVLSYPEERAGRNVPAKEAIGRAAAALVSDGDTIIADIGTTILQFVKCLATKRALDMITADVAIASYANFNLPNVRVTLPGGTLRTGHLYLAGPLTLDGMAGLFADTAFVSADAYHPDHGFTVRHDFSASIKRLYLANARRRVMLIDASKYRTTSFFRYADVGDFDAIVVDTDPEGVMREALARAARPPQLIVADELDEPGDARAAWDARVASPGRVARDPADHVGPIAPSAPDAGARP